ECGIVAEELDKSVRECDARPSVRAPAARVAQQHRSIAERIPRRIDDRLRELEGVAQSYIEALTGDGMQRLRGVAENYGARADRRSCVLERKRERAPRLHPSESAHPWREVAVELCQELGIGKRQQRLG